LRRKKGKVFSPFVFTLVIGEDPSRVKLLNLFVTFQPLLWNYKCELKTATGKSPAEMLDIVWGKCLESEDHGQRFLIGCFPHVWSNLNLPDGRKSIDPDLRKFRSENQIVAKKV